jgi:hypothetical protein
MEINKNVLDVFKSLINDIIMVSKDGDKILTIYKEILDMEELKDIKECELIHDFLKNISNNIKKISNKDETVFEEALLQNISLKDIWENEETTQKIKNNIWKYLQTFCIINININSSEELQQLLSGETNEVNKENKKDIKDIKYIKKLKESINDLNKGNKEKEVEQESFDELNNIFENTGIGKLASEIAEEIDFNDIVGENDMANNPQDILGNMMNSGNIMNLFSSINEKVQEKVNQGSINQETLSGEAEKMYEGFQNNEIFKTFMNNPEMKNMQEQMSNGLNRQEQMPDMSQMLNMVGNMMGNMPQSMMQQMPQGVPRNPTQARLQKKLQNKNKK